MRAADAVPCSRAAVPLFRVCVPQGCRTAFFCCKACRDGAGAAAHRGLCDREAGAMAALRAAAAVSSNEEAAVRLALACLSTHAVVEQDTPAARHGGVRGGPTLRDVLCQRAPPPLLGLDGEESGVALPPRIAQLSRVAASVFASRLPPSLLFGTAPDVEATLAALLTRHDSAAVTRRAPRGARVGVAFAPAATLLRHSCTPNAVVLPAALPEGGFGVDVFALRPLARGEEVRVCHVPLNMPLALRAELLAARFGVVCECVLCAAQARAPLKTQALPGPLPDGACACGGVMYRPGRTLRTDALGKAWRCSVCGRAPGGSSPWSQQRAACLPLSAVVCGGGGGGGVASPSRSRSHSPMQLRACTPDALWPPDDEALSTRGGRAGRRASPPSRAASDDAASDGGSRSSRRPRSRSSTRADTPTRMPMPPSSASFLDYGGCLLAAKLARGARAAAAALAAAESGAAAMRGGSDAAEASLAAAAASRVSGEWELALRCVSGADGAESAVRVAISVGAAASVVMLPGPAAPVRLRVADVRDALLRIRCVTAADGDAAGTTQRGGADASLTAFANGSRHALQLRLRGRGAAGSVLRLTAQFFRDSSSADAAAPRYRDDRGEAAAIAAAAAAECDAPMPPLSSFAPLCAFTLGGASDGAAMAVLWRADRGGALALAFDAADATAADCAAAAALVPHPRLAGADDAGAPCSVRVRAGTLACYESLRPRLLSALDYARRSSGGEKDAQWRLLVTGHGEGGALAALCAAELAAEGGATTTVSLATFGCPRIGDAAFAQLAEAALRGRATRVTHDASDALRRAKPPPPRGSCHVGRVLRLRAAEDAAALPARAGSNDADDDEDGSGAAVMGVYVEALARDALARWPTPRAPATKLSGGDAGGRKML
jgi:hypothetical protein